MKTLMVVGCILLGGCAYGGSEGPGSPTLEDAGTDAPVVEQDLSPCGELDAGSAITSEATACQVGGVGKWTTYTCDEGKWRSAISYCH